MTQAVIDPLSKPPKGLSALSKDQLIEECQLRGLPLPEQNTKAKMLCMIRDDVAVRQIEEAHLLVPNQTAAFPDNDEEMAASSNQRRRR